MVALDTGAAGDHLRQEALQEDPAEQAIDELFVGGRANSNLRLQWDRKKKISWRNFFIVIDRVDALG